MMIFVMRFSLGKTMVVKKPLKFLRMEAENDGWIPKLRNLLFLHDFNETLEF